MFCRQGCCRNTIADIEKAAGYTPRSGGIYRHFPSKVAILEGVIDAELTLNREAVVDVPAPPDGAPPLAVLEAVVRRGMPISLGG